MPEPLDYAKPPHPIRRDGPLAGTEAGNVVFFWLLYLLASFVIFVLKDGLHHAVLGHSPGEVSMQIYAISWQVFTAIVLIAYLLRLRHYSGSWLIAPVLGILSFLPGFIACAIRLA